jgi:hypothetical protein
MNRLFKNYEKLIVINNNNYTPFYPEQCLIVCEQIDTHKKKNINQMPIHEWVCDLSKSELQKFILDIYNLSLKHTFHELCFIYFKKYSNSL